MAFCGIDVGTQGVRAVVIDQQGTVIGSGAATFARAHRSGIRHEQQPESWWTALTAAVREATAASSELVEAVALDATSGTVLVEGVSGTPTGPALMYDDGRATDEAADAVRTGATLWRELGYRMQPAWALPKILWLLRHGHIDQGQRVVHQSDHLVGRLVGGPVATDTSNALKSGADLRTAQWPQEVFAGLGIPQGLLPDLVLPGTVVGTVGPRAAAETGLPAGAVIRAGMTDGCASQIAAGALAPGHWSSALGTTLVIKGATEQLLRDPTGAVYSHRHPDGGWLPGGASSSGAGVIASEFGDSDLGALTEAAAGLVPSDALTYPLTGVGERFPFVRPDAAAFATDESRSGSARFADLCQSVAFVERLAYEVLADLGAPVSGPVALTGGATRNNWWNQLRTDVLGLATTVPSTPDAAVGMAILAAAEPGELTATAHRMVRTHRHLDPNGARHDRFEPAYRAFVDQLVARDWLTSAPKGYLT